MSVPMPKSPVEILDQQVALTDYLEALLCPATMSLPVPVTPVQPPPVQVIIEAPVEVTAAPVAEDAVIVPTVAPEPAVQVAAAAESVEPRPAWAAEPFAALLLKVNGLTLALPLVTINRILPWEEPSYLPGYVSWLLGIVHHQDLNVRVVDTATLVMPEILRRAPEPVLPGQDEGRRIVLIAEGRWGLVCDSVSEVVTLDPDKIRWRSSRTKRPWLAGTVVDQLCALLDVERLRDVLNSGCPDLPAD
jgi:purine-binding chemotaxis protein CheW